MSIRKPAVAGMFYPKDQKSLKDMLQNYLSSVEKETDNIKKDIKKIKAIIVPHAGIVYSGQMAAQAYNLIKKCKQNKFILLGPSHNSYLKKVTADESDMWETPLGTTNIIQNNFSKDKFAHLDEHNLEVQLIFLQFIKENFKILPLLVGETKPKQIANEIESILDKDTLLIVSSDLSHFHEYDDAKEMDLKTVEAIEKQDSDSIGEACGSIPIKTVIEIAKRKNWKIKNLGYYNSGDVSGDKSRVVGYASFVVYE
jgi:MEMO1 family protein